MLDVLAQTVIEYPAFDPWIPILIWGGFAGLFLYFTAWLPAIASMMALGNALLPSPVFGRAASVMLVMICLVLHVVVVRGLLPGRWGRT
jgi:hypothetical protein